MTTSSKLAGIAALVALSLIGLAAVLFVSEGSESTQRLAMLFGIIGTGVASLVSLIRSDQSASQTNGSLDARIQAGVHRAMAARRRGEDPEEVPPPGG
jgi:hypothetical protein